MASDLQVVIREATGDDFDAWFSLYDAVAAEGTWIAGEAPSDRESRHRAFDQYLADPDAASLLAEAEGRLVGHRMGLVVDRDSPGSPYAGEA